jgi:hypothetical protein
MSSVRSSLKVIHNLRLIQGSNKGIETKKDKFPLKVANTVFYYVLLLFYGGKWIVEGFGKQTIFGYFGYYMFGN